MVRKRQTRPVLTVVDKGRKQKEGRNTHQHPLPLLCGIVWSQWLAQKHTQLTNSEHNTTYFSQSASPR